MTGTETTAEMIRRLMREGKTREEAIAIATGQKPQALQLGRKGGETVRQGGGGK